MRQHRVELIWILALLLWSCSPAAAETFTARIDSTHTVFGRPCVVLNLFRDTTHLVSGFLQAAGDTVYLVAYAIPNQPIQFVNRPLTPNFPAVGTSWFGELDRPARYEVLSAQPVVVPAGKFNGIVYSVSDSTTGQSLGEETLASGVGFVRWSGSIQGDIYDVALYGYALFGGHGVLPLAVGNRWFLGPEDTPTRASSWGSIKMKFIR